MAVITAGLRVRRPFPILFRPIIINSGRIFKVYAKNR